MYLQENILVSDLVIPNPKKLPFRLGNATLVRRRSGWIGGEMVVGRLEGGVRSKAATKIWSAGSREGGGKEEPVLGPESEFRRLPTWSCLSRALASDAKPYTTPSLELHPASARIHHNVKALPSTSKSNFPRTSLHVMHGSYEIRVHSQGARPS
jgi:hypothetical protein